MNYIQKLKWHRDQLLEFFHGFVELDAAQKKLENTGYQGDARLAVRKAYDRLNAARKDIETNILTSIQEEKKDG